MGLLVSAKHLARLAPSKCVRAWFGDLDNALFALLLLATIAPVWCFRYFPSQDGPAHLENATILKEYHQPDRTIFRTYYRINTNPDPNWLGHLLLVGLLFLVPPLTAEKLLLTGYLILLPLSMRYALNAVTRPRTRVDPVTLASSTTSPAGAGCLALLAFPLTRNLFYHMGFLQLLLQSGSVFLRCRLLAEAPRRVPQTADRGPYDPRIGALFLPSRLVGGILDRHRSVRTLADVARPAGRCTAGAAWHRVVRAGSASAFCP